MTPALDTSTAVKVATTAVRVSFSGVNHVEP